MGNKPSPLSLEKPASENGQVMPSPDPTFSYWRTELHAIDEFCSSERLPFACDIAIIGSGLSGAATAYHVSRLYAESSQKPSIVMLEARQVCSGATARNGGHAKIRSKTLRDLAEKYGRETAEEMAVLVDENIAMLKEIVEDEELDCEFELRRSYDVFIDEKEAKDAEVLWKKSIKEKQTWTRNRGFVGREFAEQVTSIKGAKAALSSNVCSLWPYKFVSQLLSRLLSSSALQLYTNTPVTSIDTFGTKSTLHTPRGSINAQKVIFATNGYTSGICPPYAATIVPCKATACHISPPTPISPHLSNTYNVFYPHTETENIKVDYLNPRPDGGIVVGGGQWTYRDDKSLWYDNFDDSTHLPFVKENHFDNLMQRDFRGWEESGAKVDHIWTGIQGITDDKQPHVGEVPGYKGWWIIAGFNGGGMAFIAPCAKAVARMVVQGTTFEETGLPRGFETRQERLK